AAAAVVGSAVAVTRTSSSISAEDSADPDGAAVAAVIGKAMTTNAATFHNERSPAARLERQLSRCRIKSRRIALPTPSGDHGAGDRAGSVAAAGQGTNSMRSAP